jgi:aminoglycoside phosphotransferase family enzyme
MSTDPAVTGPFVAVRETHVGVVFLMGELAYKLKKPVRTAFLDFSTRQRRLVACQREVGAQSAVGAGCVSRRGRGDRRRRPSL